MLPIVNQITPPTFLTWQSRSFIGSPRLPFCLTVMKSVGVLLGKFSFPNCAPYIPAPQFNSQFLKVPIVPSSPCTPLIMRPCHLEGPLPISSPAQILYLSEVKYLYTIPPLILPATLSYHLLSICSMLCTLLEVLHIQFHKYTIS